MSVVNFTSFFTREQSFFRSMICCLQGKHNWALDIPEEKVPNVYDFNPIVAAVTANNNVEATLERFRHDFTPGAIEKGKHFNMKILLAAYQAYIDNWGLWSYDQGSLFFRQVIGFLQRLLPACYAQAFCQGLYKVTENHRPLLRGLKLDDGRFFYPDGENKHAWLGFDFGVYDGWAVERGDRVFRYIFYRARKGGDDAEGSRLKSYFEQKTSALRELMQCPDNRAKQACAIM